VPEGRTTKHLHAESGTDSRADISNCRFLADLMAVASSRPPVRLLASGARRVGAVVESLPRPPLHSSSSSPPPSSPSRPSFDP